MGINYRSVKNANVASSEFQGTFSDEQNVFPVDQLVANSNPRGPFFWRVDAINEFGRVIKGRVWKFGVVT